MESLVVELLYVVVSEEKFNALLLENIELKNRNCVLATNLEDMTWQKNNLLSERHLLETEVKTLQEECYEYRRIAENASLKYSALQASNEKEMEELEARLELSETNVARCKTNFQQIQAALTAEHMRTAIHAKEEKEVRQALGYHNVKIRRLEAQNARRKIRIAELEAEMDFEGKEQVPSIPQPSVNTTTRHSNLKTFMTKIRTAMTPALKKLRSIYPSKISNWFTSPVRVFPNL